MDVITGAQFDVALDFRIAWPFPFEWRRFYNTARIADHLPLGWGHTHSYDHRLWFDMNGLLYIDPAGNRHGFPYLEASAIPCLSATGTLRLSAPETYRVKVKGFPECEFHFTDPTGPAQLRKLFLGRACHELRYASNGQWNELAYGAEPPLRIDHDRAGRIRALFWTPAHNGKERLLWEGQYDEAGNLTGVLDAYQTTQSFVYDSAHRMVGRKDRRGYGFEASYDTSGRCVRSTGEDGMQEVRLEYLPAANLTTVTRADGGAWQYFYENQGIVQTIDPYGGVTRRLYGINGRLEREIGPMDEVLREIIDEESGLLRPPFGPPAGMSLPLGDPWFEPARDRNIAADALDWEGYGAARCRNLIRFPSRESSWVKELPAAVISAIRFADVSAQPQEPAGSGPAPKKRIGVPERPGVMNYDAFGRLLSHTLPTGDTCRWQYDPNGNVTRYVDYAGSEWRYAYASWNLRIQEADPLGNTAVYAFNTLEKPTRITDGGGTSTEQGFDLKDRMTERRRHSEARDRFRYDRSCGLVSAEEGSGELRAALTIGPQRRPTEISPAEQITRRCAYDERGKLLAVTEEGGESISFAYTALGECTADLRNGRGIERRYTASRLVESALLGRFITRYVHDSATGRTTVIDPTGGHHEIRQLDSGIFLRQNANNVEELSQFDWNGRCLAKVTFKGKNTHTIWSRVYRYSPVGTLLADSDSRRGTSTYQYDSAHRLVGATAPDGARGRFGYDAAGNLLSAPGLGGVSLSENRLLSANGRRFEYNQRHHIIHETGAEKERRYEYDAEDRLVSCTIGDARNLFDYDALGRRIAKTDSEGTTQFIWDGERLAAEVSPGGQFRVYVYADAIAPTPFAFIDYDSQDASPASGQRRYVFSNQIACPVRVEDDAGEVLWRADIGAYGRATISPDSRIEFNLRWPGHYYDSETALHYNRHRYYDPELGRYIQVDPRDLDGGLNVYAYPSRPLDEVDVDGLAPCPKKPMVTPDEDDKQFQAAKQKADEVAENLRRALQDAVDNGEVHPMNAAGTTLATMVVLRKDGTYEVVVTGNRSPNGLPERVLEAADDHRFVAHNDDRPPPIRQGDEDWRYGRTKPNGDTEDSTHNHAEQRGLRAADCDPDTKGVAYVAPTRPCCEGCSSAIQTPPSDGGWGGTGDNVSDRGQQPGNHGSWW